MLPGHPIPDDPLLGTTSPTSKDLMEGAVSSSRRFQVPSKGESQGGKGTRGAGEVQCVPPFMSAGLELPPGNRTPQLAKLISLYSMGESIFKPL
jgi:hypothetical protein